MNVVRTEDSEQLVRTDAPAVPVARTLEPGAPAMAGERKFEQAEQSEKVYRRESLRSAFARYLVLQDEAGHLPPAPARAHSDD